MQSEFSRPVPSQKQLLAVPKIQKLSFPVYVILISENSAWRSYTNRKVYHYYRDIVLNKTQ